MHELLGSILLVWKGMLVVCILLNRLSYSNLKHVLLCLIIPGGNYLAKYKGGGGAVALSCGGINLKKWQVYPEWRHIRIVQYSNMTSFGIFRPKVFKFIPFFYRHYKELQMHHNT